MKSSKMAGLMGGVFLISLSALTYELVLTRIASVVMFYHFAFLAVSIALLGMSVAGIYIYLLANRFPKGRVAQQAFLSCLLFSLSLPLALVAVLNVPPEMELSLDSITTLHGLRFVLIVCAMALPFFFSGLSISLILTHFGDAASRVYFADLIGASLGCILIIPIMNLLGGIQGVLFIAILGSCAAPGIRLGARRQEAGLHRARDVPDSGTLRCLQFQPGVDTDQANERSYRGRTHLREVELLL